ncbi:MAG: extracellular solute-binding protein [Treponema sp.]|jgi:putative aldouronate transport system substrate-binding protein|nr:extracellular solute-binding protein [Treponema sp.]
MKKAMSLAVCCVAAVLCGCDKKEGSAADTSGAPIEITVEIFDRGTDGGKTDPTNNNWTKWIQEKLLKDENIKVSFVAVSRWEEVQALNNMMAAGVPPDVCVTYSNELISNYRDLGGLIDISKYIDTPILADLKKLLGPDTALPGRDLIRRNEDPETKSVYSIPARRVDTAERNLFIRKDWLDKLGLPLPTTLEEFYDALVQFKEKDPGNVGKDKAIPFIMGTDLHWTTQTICYPFIDPNISLKEYWVNSVVGRYVTMPGYKEGWRFMNKMYNAGLVDPNFALYKSESEEFNVLKSGIAGSYTDNWDRIYRDSEAIMTELRKNVPDGELVPVDCLTGPDGQIRRTVYDSAGVNFFIPASAKNPEAALRYVNWLARYENYHYLQIGAEGVNHDLVNGLPKLKTAQGPWIQNSPQNIDYTLPINGLEMGDPDLNVKALANGYAWPSELIEKAHDIAMHNGKPGPVIPVQLSAAGPVTQTLIDKFNVFAAAAMTAKPEDFDRVWDAGVADWLASGAQAVIDEKNEKFYNP